MVADLGAPREGGTVLVLNAGSTSLKFGLFRVDSTSCETLLDGDIETEDVSSAVSQAVARLAGHPAPRAVGHRIVHGGAAVRRHCLIDARVLRDLEAARALAPLHVLPALAAVRYATRHFPGLPQIACLDTAFHADMPEVARTYPLPEAIRSAGAVRYGFHGLSCQSIVRQLGDGLPERLVIAHLGGGCSVTAVQAGRSVDTTMGLTPAGGVMMTTRAGDLDPGLLIWLMRERGLDSHALETLVNRDSGLLGASGLSGDLRALRANRSAAARLAIEMLVASLAKAVAGMMTVLGGADLIICTGGIGEHDADLRQALFERLAWTGIPRRAVTALPSREDEEMARIVHALL